MKIISWNVLNTNRKLAQLLDYAFKLKPDVLCLQEIPLSAVKHIQKNTNYHVAYTYDFISKKIEGSACICTITKEKPDKTEEFVYFEKESASIMTRFLYNKLSQNTEMHKAVVTYFPNKKLAIYNVRLSCAIGTCDRLEQCQNIINSLNKEYVNILCGDFNIIDSQIFNKATGWSRGFTRKDYTLNERKEFERLCEKYGYKNIFRGQSSHRVAIPKMQFDHILVPNSVQVTNSEISEHRNGSDHKMLFAELELD